MAGIRHRAAAVQLCCIALLAVSLQSVVGQDNGQGTILYNMGKWLTTDDKATLERLGWTPGGDPCQGTWTGVTCNAEGYVATVDLANQGLTGSLPDETSVWGGLTGLTSLVLSGNSLGGTVPAAMKAAGPQLATINLSGNTGICGDAPAGLEGLNSEGTSLTKDCATLTAPAESPAVTPDASSPPPDATAASPAPDAAAPTPAQDSAANATTDAPAPSPDAAAPNATASGEETPAPAPVPAPPAAPAPPPTVIANAPVCSCALKGFGSTDCSDALKGVCAGASPPAVCAAGDPASDAAAAEQLGTYLAAACFPGQDMDTSICTCVQNLLGNDCAKARVNLCVAKDALCLPFQNIIDVNGSSNADAVGKVAPELDSKCKIAEPTVPGVKATMEFPELSMGQYITRQYTQNVANALSSVTNVPSTSISTLDVRPFISGSSTGRRRGRSLAQTSGNGVQATYFLATQDPSGVSQKLSTAANDGSLSTKLSQYGIQAQAGGLKVQSFLPAPPSNYGPAGSSSRGLPTWAIGVIAAGAALLLAAVLCLLWFCCCRKKKSKKAVEYAPETKKGAAAVETLPKSSYDYAPAPVSPSTGSGYTPVIAAAGVGAAAAAGAAAARSAPQRSATPEDLPVSRSIKVSEYEAPAGSGTLTPWEASNAAASGPRAGAAPASLAPVKTSVGGAAPAATAAGAAGAVDSSAAAAWRSNVRPASGQLPNTAGATSSMANAAGKSSQQAERAKFWAQFQETWQQVRQNQNINDDPGTPSSGTNWTDVTGQVTPKKNGQPH